MLVMGFKLGHQNQIHATLERKLSYSTTTNYMDLDLQTSFSDA